MMWQSTQACLAMEALTLVAPLCLITQLAMVRQMRATTCRQLPTKGNRRGAAVRRARLTILTRPTIADESKAGTATMRFVGFRLPTPWVCYSWHAWCLVA